MQKRRLGKTKLMVSMLGLGGFHLLEVPTEEAKSLIDQYIDGGGNYVETSANYGDGESELKIGKALEHRRDGIILATKSGARDREGFTKNLERSLRNLRTDHVDVMFMHSVGTYEDIDKMLGPGGSMEAMEKARKDGKVRFIAASCHGQPGTLIEAIHRYPFDAVMSTLNYYDRCNFPELENELIPLCQKQDVGLMAMKALADGYLWRSVAQGLRYTWSLPGVAMIVAGANSKEMLAEDIAHANAFQQMSAQEVEQWLRQAPELGNYVCRQCASCPVCERFPVKDVFRLEGYYDRQMRDGDPRTPPEYALRDRLRFWFNQKDMAREEYRKLGVDASRVCDGCSTDECDKRCKHGLPIKYKLRYAHYKLSGEPEAF